MGWAGARGLTDKCVLDAPCSAAVGGETSGRFVDNGRFPDGRASDSCALNGSLRVEAACAKSVGNTVGTFELSKADFSRLCLDDR